MQRSLWQYKYSQLCSQKVVQNDDVQDFDVRWDQALLSVSEMPSDVILVQLKTVLALYHQVTARSKRPNYQQMKTAVKVHVDQMMRTRNFRVRSDVVERGSVTKSQNGKKANVERKVGECFQWKAHGQCSKGESCRFSHDTNASGNSGGSQRPTGRPSSPAPSSKAKYTEKGDKEESSDMRSHNVCREKCNNP